MRVLGPLEVWRGGAMVPIGGPKARITLAVLLAHRPSVVSVDRLADALWGDVPPESAVATIQSNMSRLRKTLAPEVEILARAPGYLLEAPPDCIDATRFAGLVARRDHGGDAGGRRRAARERAGVVEGARVRRVRATSTGRAATRCDSKSFGWSRSKTLLEARLALGEAGAVVGELERLVVDHPLRERFWRQLMVALYRTGRQGEALRQANQLRAFLGDELGLDLSPAARELEAAHPRRRSDAAGRRAAAGAITVVPTRPHPRPTRPGSWVVTTTSTRFGASSRPIAS